LIPTQNCIEIKKVLFDPFRNPKMENFGYSNVGPIEVVFVKPEKVDERRWMCHHTFCNAKFYDDEELKMHLWKVHDKM
jgi:hypothetical protein